MTEVVTSTAASVQQSAFAEYQRKAIERVPQQNESLSDVAAIRPTRRVAPDSVARTGAGDQSSLQRDQSRPQQEPVRRVTPKPEDVQAKAPEPKAAPDAPRADREPVEVKDFDIGRRAAEIVGTVDVVQRFDTNQDGRVDSLESQRASRARSESFTFKARGGLGVGLQEAAENIQAREIKQAVSDGAALDVQPPEAPRQESAPTAPEARGPQPGEPHKLFSGAGEDGQPEGVVPKKVFSDGEVASQGHFADGVVVDQKFYGDGAELVRGRFGDDPAVRQKLSEKTEDAERGQFYEDGNGEQKLYDKVAQSEDGRFAEDPAQQKLYDKTAEQQEGRFAEDAGSEQTLYERAQEVKEQTAGGDGTSEAQPKKIYGELDAYVEVSGDGNVVTEPSTDVTA